MQTPLGPSRLTFAWNFFSFHSALDIETFYVMHCFKMCYSASNKCWVPLISFPLWLSHSLRFTFPAEPLLFWPTRKSITASETQSAIHREMESQHASTYLHSQRVCHYPLETTHFLCELPPNSIEYKMLWIPYRPFHLR